MNLRAFRQHPRNAVIELAERGDARDDGRKAAAGLGRRHELAGVGVRMHGRRLEKVGRRRPRIPRLVERRPQELERSARRSAIDLAAERGAVVGAAPDVIGVAVEQVGIAVVERLLSNEGVGDVRRWRTMRTKLAADQEEQPLGRRQRDRRRGRCGARPDVRGLECDEQAEQRERGDEGGFQRGAIRIAPSRRITSPLII